MLKGFIYFEYVKDTANQITSQGQKIPQGENSLTATTLYNMMYTRYWEALKTYRAIQWYIYRYQLQAGQVLNYAVLNIGNNYNDGIYFPTGGTGTGFKLNCFFSPTGSIGDIAVLDQGVNYSSGDEVTLIGGNNSAKLLIVHVGKGDYTKWNGVPKQMAYWL
jgi:hypothetical protein